jgi:FAD/FMN-containing dehydrogenase
VKVTALDHERLFEPFLDEVDGVLCVSSEATAAEVARLAEPHSLRFPLWLDPTQSLRANLAAADHAPASSRFGPFCDNITGMNWELPDGRMVRVGERVVKSTTGYDLLRFLLGSGDRFGRATDYVLRLRPLCDRDGAFLLGGPERALEQAVAEILHGPFLHWLDSVDWMTGKDQAPQLRVGVHCPAAEWPVFADHLASLAAKHALNINEKPGSELVADGLPDLALKTTPDQVIPLCRDLASHGEIRCTGLCYPGVVHVDLRNAADPAAAVAEIVHRTATRLEQAGGDWISRHAVRPVGSEEEDRWVRELLAEWKEAA